MSGELTLVALAGATGSGKSSLFNALTGLDLAAIGTRRPTSSMPLACVWGEEPAGEVLNWLGIPRRHQVQHRSSLEEAQSEDLDGLILLDLPDHDSTEVEHRLIVDRLVELVDMLVWVVDPQKYADAALHNRYIKPFASHSGVMVFALNHIDKLTPDQRKSCLNDLDRLLKSDGLKSPNVVATSAVSGDGLDELRALLVKRVSNKRSAARERLAADVDRVADRMASQCGNAKTPEIAKSDITELVDALSDASGVPVVVDAVRRSYLQRARAATGWPVTKWLGRFRPDPLRRLHLDQVSRQQGKALRKSASHEVAIARSSLPAATPVQRARMDTAVRTITNKAAEGIVASVGRLGSHGDPPPRGVARRRARPGGRADRSRRGQQPWLVECCSVHPVGAVPDRARRRAVAGRGGRVRIRGSWTIRRSRSGTAFRTPAIMLIGGAVLGLAALLRLPPLRDQWSRPSLPPGRQGTPHRTRERLPTATLWRRPAKSSTPTPPAATA